MVLFVVSILFLLLAVGFYTWGKLGDQSTENKVDKDAKLTRRLSLIPFGLFVLFLALSCVKIVPANSVGIPVTFGSIGDSINSGFHITTPFTKVHTFSTRLQESTMSGDPTEGDRKTDDAVDVRGSDEGVVYLDVTIKYTVSQTTASELFKLTGSMDGIRDRIIRPDTRSIIRDVAKDYLASDLVASKRSEVEARTSEILNQRMKDTYGINVTAVLLRGVRPSEQVEKAIQAKLTKAQEVEQALLQQQKEATEAETRNKVALTDAATAKTKAQGVADAQRIAAQGEADANSKISASLTPAIIEKAKVDALARGTVYVVPESGQFILGSIK